MDLLCKKYASPYSFLDIAISQKRLSECVDFIIDKNEEQKQWEYYLHKGDPSISFETFRQQIIQKEIAPNKIDFGATMKQSQEILNDFNPYS